MKISLSPEIERLIEEKLRTGRYRSADQLVREGLKLLQEHEQELNPPGSPTSSDFVPAFEAISQKIPDTEWEKLPADLSKNLDHYLYGRPKTS